MNTDLTTNEELKLLRLVEGYGMKQLETKEIAAQLGYSEAEFAEILETRPKVKRILDLARIKGLGRIREELWDKAFKHYDALKYIAAEYLKLGVPNNTEPFEKRFKVSIEKMKKIHDILIS